MYLLILDAHQKGHSESVCSTPVWPCQEVKDKRISDYQDFNSLFTHHPLDALQEDDEQSEVMDCETRRGSNWACIYM